MQKFRCKLAVSAIGFIVAVTLSKTMRITHTWIKRGHEWKIIGGMSMLEQ